MGRAKGGRETRAMGIGECGGRGRKGVKGVRRVVVVVGVVLLVGVVLRWREMALMGVSEGRGRRLALLRRRAEAMSGSYWGEREVCWGRSSEVTVEELYWYLEVRLPSLSCISA